MKRHREVVPSRRVWLLMLAVAVWGTARVGVAQGPGSVDVSGVVRDAAGEALGGGSVTLAGGSSRTDAAGRWSLTVPPGTHLLQVSLDGFISVERQLRVVAGLGPVEVTLTRALRLDQETVVQAVRADDRSPVTRTDIDHEQIDRVNRGQEMPFLLGPTPSINFNSDSGVAAGYSYLNLRGIGQTRLNITLDGVPLQDPEDQALYFANFGDFASAVDSIQVQRGIGTSSPGAASYGGSVNFASVSPADQTGVQAQLGGGSWGTARATVAVDSGPIGAGFALQGRYSAQTSDGFRDRSGVEQRTVYLGGTRQDERSLLKVFGFIGREKTKLAYLATDEATLEEDLQFNPLPPGEEDDFGQDFFQAQYTRQLGEASTVTVQGYYNGAQGWFRIQDPASGALQEFSIDGHFVGLILGATHRAGRLGLEWGAHINDFTRDHSMALVDGAEQYRNAGLKNEASTFLRGSWEAGPAELWADAQLRYARFEYRGDQDLGSVDWTFFNPKVGIRYDPLPEVGLYGFVGRLSREPTRSDMLRGEDNASAPYDLRAVEPEKVFNVEAGVEVQRRNLRVKANFYAMEFRDEIALSGELSEIGLPLRRNVPRSHRRGFEVELDWQPEARWRVHGTASFSRNRIDEWTQFYDVYDSGGSWIDSVPLVHRDVAPLLTPPVLLNAALDWMPRPELTLGLGARWVAESQLDNTGSPEFRTPSWFNLDARLTLSLERWLKRGAPRIRIEGTNLLDNRRLWPSGYSYQYFVRDAGGGDALDGTSFFYPLATRSVHATVDVAF